MPESKKYSEDAALRCWAMTSSTVVVVVVVVVVIVVVVVVVKD